MHPVSTLLFAILALLGLSDREHPGPGERGQLPDPVPAPASLALRVALPDLAPVGMVIPFRVALANQGDRAVQVELGGRPIAFDLIVRNPTGQIVWRRLEGVPMEMVLVTRTVAAGEVLTFDDHWDQRDREGRRVAPGVYRVQAVLPVPGVAGGWGSTIREVTITP